ncbi:hypothetical protein EJP02_117 [Escherichia phage EJP2]|nr:hypothetical protein EJP02_117 [Escherichia phage EJP2]
MIYIILGVITMAITILLLIVGDKVGVVEEPPGLVRNYEVRFEPSNNKYYLVNVLPKKEVPVTNWYGKRIMYKDMILADYVREKMNSVK